MAAGATPAEAEDAADAAFEEAWRLTSHDPARWTQIANPRAWLAAVAMRKFYRPDGPRKRPLIAADAEIPEEPSTEPDPADKVAARDLLESLLSQLTPRERAVMTAMYTLDLSTQEVADMLQLSRSTVRVLRKRAVDKMRRNFKLNSA